MARESGRPLPTFSEDDVLNFMVTEAVVTRVHDEREAAEEKRQRQAWKKGHKDLPEPPPAVG